MNADARMAGGARRFPWRIAGWGTAALLLILPLVTGAPWTGSDYVAAAAMFGFVGGSLELVFRKIVNRDYRLGVAAAVAAAFLLFWVSGAVGIIGSEQDDANMLYLSVLTLALFGSLASLFRAKGMAVTMTAVAVAQVAVPVIGWFAWPEARQAILAPEVPISTIAFAGMWLTSAALFRRAAEQSI